MNIQAEILKQKLSLPLPGKASHLKMSTKARLEEFERYNFNIQSAKKSAVFILFFEEDSKTKVIFIRRSNYVGIHAGQIAFPGGRFEDKDIELKNTALREVQEEIGIPPNEIELLGRLSDIYLPPSNFNLSVFVGFLTQKPVYQPDSREVAEVIEVDMDNFYAENVIQEKEFFVPSNNYSVVAPYYNVKNAEIWGASAMVMTELMDVIQSESRA